MISLITCQIWRVQLPNVAKDFEAAQYDTVKAFKNKSDNGPLFFLFYEQHQNTLNIHALYESFLISLNQLS